MSAGPLRAGGVVGGRGGGEAPLLPGGQQGAAPGHGGVCGGGQHVDVLRLGAEEDVQAALVLLQGEGLLDGDLLPTAAEVEVFEDVVGACHQTGAVAEEAEAAGGGGGEDGAGDGEDVAALVGGEVDGDQGAGAGGGLDDEDGEGKAGDDPVAGRKILGVGFAAGRVVGEEGALLGDARSEE